MLRIQRTEGREVVAIDGRSFALVSKTRTIRLATPWVGIGRGRREDRRRAGDRPDQTSGHDVAQPPQSVAGARLMNDTPSMAP